jgi:hypothetical protein
MKRTMGTALALAAAMSLAVTALTDTAAAGTRRGHRHRRDADVTFTKWVTSEPTDPSTLAGASMAGVVGGDAGRGVFAGRILRDDTTSRPGFWLGEALYGFHGRRHSFVAHNFITENDGASPVTATIRGVVIRGWMRGARVTGGYTMWDACPVPTPGNVFGTACFQGKLHLHFRARR